MKKVPFARTVLIVAIAASLAVVALAITGCSCSSTSSSSAASSSSASSSSSAAQDVIVPDLKGKTQADAEKALADVKLVGIAGIPEESTEVDPGLVCNQSIAPGATAKEGDKVVFAIAVAPAEVEVPDVVGKTHDEAKQILTDAKLGFDSTASYDDKAPEGTVIVQSVAAGTKVKSGTTVSVLISLGPKPTENVKVPDVMTYTWPEAQAALSSAGLNASYTGDVSGVVIAQSVTAGTSVAPGTAVTVTLEGQGGQNPVMNFIGKYGHDRATIYVGPLGDTDASITVEWPNSAAETITWTMTGTFDPNTYKVKYTNGKKTIVTHSSDGKDTSEEVVYTDGTGTFTFKDGSPLSITWDDEMEHVAAGLTFTYVVM